MASGWYFLLLPPRLPGGEESCRGEGRERGILHTHLHHLPHPHNTHIHMLSHTPSQHHTLTGRGSSPGEICLLVMFCILRSNLSASSIFSPIDLGSHMAVTWQSHGSHMIITYMYYTVTHTLRRKVMYSGGNDKAHDGHMIHSLQLLV